MYVLGATVKDIVADLAHTDEFEDKLFWSKRRSRMPCGYCAFDIACWRVSSRAWRTGSGRPSSRKMVGKPLTKSGISIIRGHLSDCTRDLPAGSQPTGRDLTGTGLYNFFVLPFFTLAHLKSS